LYNERCCERYCIRRVFYGKFRVITFDHQQNLHLKRRDRHPKKCVGRFTLLARPQRYVRNLQILLSLTLINRAIGFVEKIISRLFDRRILTFGRLRDLGLSRQANRVECQHVNKKILNIISYFNNL
jgi:hypothetical protein